MGAKISSFGPTSQHPLVAHIEFVLEDKFQELTMAQSAGSRLLKPNIEGLQKARET
jgi:hypothetical protein